MNVLPIILQTVQKAFEHTDKEMEGFKKACTRGCDACCYQMVSINTWEEIRIVEYIHNQIGKKTKAILKDNLEKWFYEFNSITRDASRATPLVPDEMEIAKHNFRENRVACPLLINSKCAIYKVRPIICRVHIETDNPDNCKKDPHKMTHPDALRIYKKTAHPSNFNPKIYPLMNRPIAYAVAGEIGYKVKVKPIAVLGVDLRSGSRNTGPAPWH